MIFLLEMQRMVLLILTQHLKSLCVHRPQNFDQCCKLVMTGVSCYKNSSLHNYCQVSTQKHQNRLKLMLTPEPCTGWNSEVKPVFKLPITIDPESKIHRRKPKTTHSWIWGATVRPRLRDWITDTSIGQPSSITAV